MLNSLSVIETENKDLNEFVSEGHLYSFRLLAERVHLSDCDMVNRYVSYLRGGTHYVWRGPIDLPEPKLFVLL